MAFMSFVNVNAQSMNYAGDSNFGDNWSVTLQGGVVTPFNSFFSGHTAMTPIVSLGLDKYITPVVGFGVDGRVGIGTGTVGYHDGVFHNSHTAFDAVNVSGYAKFNLANLVDFTGFRHLFEPVVYTGLGWGHTTASNSLGKHDNYMTWRSGAELNFNLGRSRAWAIVVNPSVVFGNPSTHYWDTKLNKNHGYFECTAGIVYHLRTSNGTHSFTRPTLYDADEVSQLNREIAELRKKVSEQPSTPVVVERVVERTVEKVIKTPYEVTVQFAFDSAELSEDALVDLQCIVKENVNSVAILAFASPEGSEEYNMKLSQRRADVIADFFKKHNVEVSVSEGVGAVCQEANRIAIVTVR